MNSAIIVAAGAGTRFESTRPKQFLEILGKPVIIHTLERFDACTDIDRIVLVLATDEIEFGRGLLERYQIRKEVVLAEGGDTRSRSVANGLAELGEDTAIVVIHDGARPLVSPEEITRTLEAAVDTGAACLVASVTDTIKEVDGDRVTGTKDRRRLRRALTPQAFRFELLKKVLSGADSNEAATDECILFEKAGYEVAAVPGNARNIKITFPEDLIFAEACIRAAAN